ncbi:MAG: fimbrillin family protein, partial [Alistipes sp.]|nr:fimbrillin family protein [Alistipes sp.]
MKKILATAFLVALSTQSCTQETTLKAGDDTAADGRLVFSTSLDHDKTRGTGGQTRSAAMTDAAAMASAGGFKVWAVSHDEPWAETPDTKTAILDGVTVTGNQSGTVWSYDDPVEWPDGRYVSFFAIAPASVAVDGSATAGTLSTSYTVDPDPADQTDLVFAHPVYDRTGSTYSAGRPLTLNFGHALSRIVFTGIILNESGSDPRTVKVTGITLDGLYDSGTADLDVPIEWTLSGTASASYSLSRGEGELVDVALSTAAPVSLIPSDGYLFLVPQSLERAAGAEPTMSVTLEISDQEGLNPQTIVAPARSLFSPSEWLAGKSYEYRVIVDGDDVRIVGAAMADLTLEPWKVSVYINPVVMVQGNPDKNAAKFGAAI